MSLLSFNNMHLPKGRSDEAGWVLPASLLLLTVTGVLITTLFLVVHGVISRERYTEASVLARELAIDGAERMIALTHMESLDQLSTDVTLSGNGTGGTYTAHITANSPMGHLTIFSQSMTPSGAQASLQVGVDVVRHLITKWQQQP